jgi:DNA repair photolyase
MRWDNLKVGSDEARSLPGYREPATIRTFDAPESLDTRFYEVQARSVINKVPERSQMPFRYTINPYRGCSHACTYCAAGDSPVLMADGRTVPLAGLSAGDLVYGTEVRGSYRRYVVTEVLDHWSTIKPAYRITLEDGTELVASGDHRFLTNRGWKHVIGAERPLQRPHLTLNNELMGTGAFAAQPDDSGDYRLGYVCGMVRGDANLASYSYERSGRKHGDVHRFRLALVDIEPLQRTREYLLDFAVATDRFAFARAAGNARAITAIRTSSKANVERVRELIRWPRSASDDWCKGFLAGIYDAEGGRSQGVLRISNTDPEILDWTCYCLRRFGFPHVREDRALANRLVSIRLTEGLREHLRFFHTVDPATSRKRSIEGAAIKTKARLGVKSIEPLGGAMRLYDITTATGDFIANGVVSHNCFARPTHTYLGFDADRDFEREIVVKVNAPEVARAQLMKPSWKREHVALGTNTDPYQWVESKYRLMPGIWEALRDSGTPCSVLTKSPLLLCDIDLMKELHERVGFAANLSIPTLDEKAWRATEPRTPNPRARIEAVAELNRAGVPCGVLIAPLMPGINDSPEQVERIIELCTEAGATDIGGICLHLRGEVRGIFMNWLRSQRPDLVPRYERLYARGAYAPQAERKRIAALVRGKGRTTRTLPPSLTEEPVAAMPAPRQEALF